MKLLFVSTYHYPAKPAQFKHGLVMARAYAQILKDHFLYLVPFVRDETQLDAVPYKEMMRSSWRLRRKRLLTLYLFFYLPIFFLKHSSWSGEKVVVITQESKIAFLLLLFRPFFSYRVVYECHGLHSRFTDRFVCRNANALIFVTKQSEKDAAQRFAHHTPSACIPNAFDADDFTEAQNTDQAVLRAELGLPSGKRLVGYIGRFRALGQDKGIDAGLHAVASLQDNNVMFCFVGGTQIEIAEYTQTAKKLNVAERVIFVPFLTDAKMVARYTCAMDILMYAPPATKFFMEETSPMKLYEYMGAGKPIVVSDFPSMREILSDTEAFFFSEGTLSQTIAYVLAHEQEARGRAQAAFLRVKGNTWLSRGEQMLAFIKSALV